jgi:polyhydroxyalkanoate synthesis regulator protein
MGSYLEKSLQIFLDQQHQFRSQLNNILGQTPWSMLNNMTERNLDLWNSVQQRFLNAASQVREDADKDAQTARDKAAGKNPR